MEKCNIANLCGGCIYSGLDYNKQLEEKQQSINELLKKYGKVEPIIGMTNPIHYRNKVHHAFYSDRKGNIISGIYEPNSHRVVGTDNCLLEDKECQDIITTIRNLLKSFKIDVFNEKTKQGILRHILVRKGFSTKEIMVVIVTSSSIFPSKNNFVKAILKEHPNITTIVHNINNKHTSMILGEKSTTLYGKGYIKDILCGLTFRISPQSFYQINPIQTEKLYSLAIEYANITKEDIVLDAYCGIGTIGMIASKNANKVIGVELNPDAIKDAKDNARDNKIDNILFFTKDATQFINEFALKKEKIDILIMDPPRAGSTEIFLKTIIKLSPRKIIYVSCNPETLSRDLHTLTKQYSVNRIQPVDMFPLTEHIECICVLEKQT